MIKKLFILLILILTFTTFAFAQTKSNDEIERQIKTLKVEKTITLSYDESGGTSKIFVLGEDFGREQDNRAGLNGFSFGMAFFYPGKTLNAAPEEIALTFWAQSKKPKFGESHSLLIFADSETIDLGKARYLSRPNEKTEYLNFKISRENLLKIANSTNSGLKIGNAKFQFTPEHLRSFTALMKISNPTELFSDYD